MAGTYWLTVLPDTSKLKPAIEAAMRGQKIKADFGIDEQKARKAGEQAAKEAEQAADKVKPKIKPTADKPASKKAGDESGKSVADAFKAAANGEKLGSDVGGKVASGLKSSLSLIGPMLAGASIFGGLKASLAEGMDFTSSLNVMAGVSRATAEQLQQVSDAARQLGADATLPGVSATTAAQAMTELAKGGFNVQQSMDAARGTLQLAGAAGIDAATAATIQADALHAFGLSAKDAGYAADVLANVANASTGEITDFAAGFQQAGAVASQFGLSIDDTAAALGALANQGIKGSDAGTLLKSSLLAITDQGNPAQGAIKELGLTLYDAQGKFVGMRSMLDQLGQAAKRMSPEAYQAATNILYGSDAARLAGVAAKDGAAGFDVLKEAVNKQGGAADMATARTKGLPGAWAQFQNTVDGVKLSVYDLVQGPLTSLLNKLSGLPDWVSRNSGALKVMAGVIGTVLIPAFTLWIATQARALAISIAGGIGSIIGAWGTIAGSILNAAAAAGTFAVALARTVAASVLSGLSTMVAAFRNLSIGTRLAAAAQWALNVAMTANPIGLIIAAVVAVGVALWAFFTKTETGRKWWAAIWSSIKTAAGAVWEWIKGALSTLGDALRNIWTHIQPAVAAFGRFYMAVLKLDFKIFMAVLKTVGQIIGWLWQNVATPAFNGIKSAVELMWTGAKVVWDAFTTALRNVGDKVLAFKDGLVKAFNAVKDVVVGVWDKIGGIIDKIGNGIGRVSDFLKGAGGAVLNAIGLGGGATGGYVMSRYAEGGRISGPGSGTSDSILGFPAMVRVANGEYIVNAQSTARYLPLLQALNGNRALPGYYGGGQVALGNISGAGITSSEQQSMWDAVRSAFPDAVLSSATRTVMTEGHADYHNAARAIDISGPGMAQVASWIASNYPDSLELIHSPFGHNIKNGKDVGDGVGLYGAGTMAGHRDHVHWALGHEANTDIGASTSGSSSSSSSGGGGSYRTATESELSASSASVSSANKSVTQAQQRVDDRTFTRDQAQKRLDAAKASGKDTSDEEESLRRANRELADANDNLADKRRKAGEVQAADTELRTKGKLDGSAKSGDKSSGMDASSLGKTFVSGLLESVGLDGSLFSNPMEWPTVKSAMAGINFFGGLLSGGTGDSGATSGSAGGFASGIADSVGLGGLLSAIPGADSVLDPQSGSPALAPGEFNPAIAGSGISTPVGAASVFAPNGTPNGNGAAPGQVDNSINITGPVGMAPADLRTQMTSENNARTRTYSNGKQP